MTENGTATPITEAEIRDVGNSTETTDELMATIRRIDAIWAGCPKSGNGAHQWNLDTVRCTYCDNPFPYGHTTEGQGR